MLKGRKPIDLSKIKCIVIDEADEFLRDDKNFEYIKALSVYKHVEEAKP
jgi:hypothetical protein